MSESATRSQSRMLSQKPARGFHGIQQMIGHLPAGVRQLPLGLPLEVGDEIVRFADAHDPAAGGRARTRFRMAAKSFSVSVVAGLSAASNNQASNSGVTLKGLC